MFWYTKSNAEHDKIKTPDFQVPVIYICERKSIYELMTLNSQGTF